MAVDPETESTVALFNPRTHEWEKHFGWNDDHRTIVGLAPIGRATVVALSLNDELRLEAREFWFNVGLLP